MPCACDDVSQYDTVVLPVFQKLCVPPVSV